MNKCSKIFIIITTKWTSEDIAHYLLWLSSKYIKSVLWNLLSHCFSEIRQKQISMLSFAQSKEKFMQTQAKSEQSKVLQSLYVWLPVCLSVCHKTGRLHNTTAISLQLVRKVCACWREREKEIFRFFHFEEIVNDTVHH